MNSNYLFGIFGAILIVAVGLFLLGRDGTENTSPKQEVSNTETSESLPQNTTLNEEATGTPQLESETDADASSNETKELPDTEATETSEDDTKTVIVSYTDQGFSPKSIAINEGDTVTWVNESSRGMWVASDIHPTHNEYPEESASDCSGSSFDACGAFSPGENWSFTFNEVGEWGYHDDLNLSRTGIVVVK